MVSRVELMVLGVLAEGEAHGYQLYRHLDDQGFLRWSRVSKVAVYKALAKLEREGYLVSRTGREGNAPERKVYAITAQGEERLRDLVFLALCEEEPLRMEETIVLPFLKFLGRDEVLEGLERRISYLKARLKRLRREGELLKDLDEGLKDLIRMKEEGRYQEEIRCLEELRERWS